jgi:tetratricopeptide (TPR) repeat protein
MTTRRLLTLLIMVTLLLTASLALTQAQDTACDPAVNTFEQGEALFALGDYAGAVRAYSCALQSRPDNVAILNGRGNAYRQLGNLAEALVDYNRAIELDSSNAVFFNNRGYVYYQQEAMNEALADFNQAIALDPNLAYAYNNRGLIYAERGQIDLAAADFNKAIELGHDPISWPTLNLANMGLSAQPTLPQPPTETPEFLATLPPAPTIEPDDVAQGQAAYRTEDYETAVAAFTRAIEKTGESAFLFCERAAAYYMMGDYENAAVDYTRAIELGDAAMHYVGRGNSYAHLGENDKAFADYQSALERNPNYLNAYLYSAALHVEQLDKILARTDFKHWLEGKAPQIVTIDPPPEGETLALDFVTGQEVYAITFSTNPGDEISAETVIPVGSGLDSLLVLSSEGVPVGLDDDSGPGLNAQITDFSAPASCSYTLYVTQQSGVGQVELNLKVVQFGGIVVGSWPCWGRQQQFPPQD